MKTDLNPNDELKSRIMALKPLPSEWTKAFILTFPEYNNLEGIDKVRNVVYTKVSDLSITEKMELLFKRSKSKIRNKSHITK